MRLHFIHDWSRWTKIQAVEITTNTYTFTDTRRTRQMQERSCKVCAIQQYRAAHA